MSEVAVTSGPEDDVNPEVDSLTEPRKNMPFEHTPVDADAARRRAAEAVW